MSSYLDQILQGQAQSKITGRGALQPGQVEAAFQGDIAARYQAEAKSQEIGLQTKAEAAQESQFTAGQAQQASQFSQQLGLSTEAQQASESQFSQSQAQQQSQFTAGQAQQQSQFTAGQAQQASQFGQTMAYNQAALDAQQSIGKTQSIVSGVGAAGQAAVGGALAKQAFFPATGTGTDATAGAISSSTEAAAQTGALASGAETTAAYTPAVAATADTVGTTSSGALVYGSSDYGAAVTAVTGQEAGSKGAVAAVEELGADAAPLVF